MKGYGLKIEEYIRKFGSASRFFQKVINSIEFPIAIVNAKTRKVEVSNRPNFPIGGKCSDFFNKVGKNFCASDRCPVSRVVASKKSVKVDINIFNGESFHVHGHPILDSEGEVVSIILYAMGAGSDKVLMEREKKFSSCFKGAWDPIFIVNMSKRIVDCNDAAVTLSGHTRQDLLEMSILDIISKGCFDKANSVFSGDFDNIKSGCETEIIKKGRHMKIPVSVGISKLEIKGVSYLQLIFRDITEVKNIEKSLRESREELRLILVNSTPIIFSLDKECIFTLSEGASLSALGLSPGQVVGESALEIYKDYPIIIDAIGQALKGETTRCVAEIKDTSSESLFFSCFFSPKKDSNGFISGVVGMAVDVTDTKKAEEGLHIKDIVFESSLSANSIADFNGNLTCVNQSFLDMWGFESRDEVLGKPISYFLKNKEEANKVVKYLERFDRWKGDYVASRKDGSTFIAYGLATKLLNKSGKLVGYQSSVENVTGVRESERLLEKKNKRYVEKVEERFYSILQNSQDLVYRYNFSNDSFDYVSESVFTILGYSLAEFIKMNRAEYDSRIHPEDRDIVNNFGDDSESESGSSIEYRFKNKSGKYIWLEGKRIFFRDKEGKLTYSIEDLRNITERKSVEEDNAKLVDRISQMKDRVLKTKEKVSLTDREKVVLWGISRYPLLNDEELASKLALKRSTLTAIKNRLIGRDWFRISYVPNFHKLGFQFFSIFEANFKQGGVAGVDFIKNNPNVVLSNCQDNKFLAGFVSDKYVDFKRFLEDISGIDSLKCGIDEDSFFYDLDKVLLSDPSGLINSSFNLKMKEGPVSHKFENGFEKLSVNEKRILHAMVKYPKMSSAEIAKKIWTSNPTVIKIRKKLLDDGYLYPYIIPDFKKMGFSHIAWLSFEFASGMSTIINKEPFVSEVLFRVDGKRKTTRIMLFSNEEEYIEEVDLIKEFYRKKGVDFNFKGGVFPLQKRRSNTSKIESFIADKLFEDEI